MEKARLIELICSELQTQKESLSGGGRTAAEIAAATAAIDQQLQMYRFLPRREFTAEDIVVPSALVKISVLTQVMAKGPESYCLLVPSGGGLVMQLDGYPVQVVTPKSPLGEALLGKGVGDLIRLEVREQVREYRVVSIT